MRKKDNFEGQKLIALPKKVQKNINLTSFLHITDIGYFPDAKHHYREKRIPRVYSYILCRRLWLNNSRWKKASFI